MTHILQLNVYIISTGPLYQPAYPGSLIRALIVNLCILATILATSFGKMFLLGVLFEMKIVHSD